MDLDCDCPACAMTGELLDTASRWREAARQLNQRLRNAGLPYETGPGWDVRDAALL